MTDQAESARYCGQCGERNPAVNRFCVECGARLLRSDELDAAGAIADTVDARLAGLAQLPEPAIVWPDDLPRQITGADGALLRLVPGGFFWMGTRERKPKKKDERPFHLVWLDPYYLDEHPVTMGQYARFLSASGHRKPASFTSRRRSPDDPEWARLPVTQVSWQDAQAYAKWAQRRLPTEAEWEKGARGVDGRTYPWGEEPPDGRAAFGDESALPDATGRFPNGVSPYGIQDLAGTVWEWCEDEYDQDFYPRGPPRNPCCRDAPHPPEADYRVLRGGSVQSSAFCLRATFRAFNLAKMTSPVYGFRCAADVARYRRP